MTDESQLSGTIPTELRGLTNLAYLNLANNNLHGTVPTLLAALENLGMLCFALVLYFYHLEFDDCSPYRNDHVISCHVQKYFFYTATILQAI